MEYTCPSGRKCTIINILADGTIRDSMAGYVIDFEKHPDILVTFEAIMNQIERDKKEKQYLEEREALRKG